MQVICRQLNFYAAIEGFTSHTSEYPDGTGFIHLSQVNCQGSEESLDECTHLGWGVNSCNHAQDAGVSCQEGRMRGDVLRGQIGTRNIGTRAYLKNYFI